MRRLAIALLWAVLGYVAGAVIGYLLVQAFSTNRHDKELEAAMSAAFFYGPAGGIVAFVVGLLRGGRRG